MRMIHEDFKVGEPCPRPGTYACLACRNAGRSTQVQVEEGSPFPFCDTCREREAHEMDVLWRKAG